MMGVARHHDDVSCPASRGDDRGTTSSAAWRCCRPWADGQTASSGESPLELWRPLRDVRAASSCKVCEVAHYSLHLMFPTRRAWSLGYKTRSCQSRLGWTGNRHGTPGRRFFSPTCNVRAQRSPLTSPLRGSPPRLTSRATVGSSRPTVKDRRVSARILVGILRFPAGLRRLLSRPNEQDPPSSIGQGCGPPRRSPKKAAGPAV